MSTALQLAQYLRQNTTDSGTGPATIVGQTGEHGRFVRWIIDAYTELQQEKEWRWMRKSFTVNTVADDGEYAYTDCTDTVSLAAISRFSYWYKYSFKCYLTSAGVGAEYPLQWAEWENFRREYRYGTQTSGQPEHVSIDPTEKFCLGPKPSAVYTVTGDYQIGPQTLALDADVPEMPTQFHNLIVYMAMSKYGFNRVAPEAIQRAALEGGRLYAQLMKNQLPGISVGPPLA